MTDREGQAKGAELKGGEKEFTIIWGKAVRGETYSCFLIVFKTCCLQAQPIQ